MRLSLIASCCVLCALLRASAARGEEWAPAAEERRSPHHGRSFLEMGTGLALGTGGYWLLMRRNIADWDNPKPWSRFDGSAWVLDNNSIGVNFLGHPAAGGLSYSFARANHQGVAGAFAYGFLTSFLWEFVIEFKEKVSVNDVLVTPGAGLPIGEFFYKLGLYLDSGHHDSAGMDVLRAVLGSGVALDRKLDGRAPPTVSARDGLGFSSAIWHEFAVEYGVSALSAPAAADYARFHLGALAKLVTLPGYGRAGALARAFWGAEMSTFSMTAEASGYGWGLLAAADTMLVGYHAQELERDGGALRGHSWTVGSSVGWDYLRSAANRSGVVEEAVAEPGPKLSYHAPNRRDQYAALQLPGMAAEFRLLRRWGSVQAAARVQPSFAGLGAVAFYDWAADNLDERTKHILHRQGYFYGWGGAASLDARLALGPLRASFELMYGAYRSQDGWDRHPEQLSVDVPARGDVLRYRGVLGLAPNGGGMSVGLSLGVRRFHSRVGAFERTVRTVERGLNATWLF